MPDEIGLNLNHTKPRLIVYTTFSNDGSPNTWKTIKNINATGWIYHEEKDKPSEELEFQWHYTNRFISDIEYERLYPNYTTLGAQDYVTYEGRKAPFTLPGKATVPKLLYFIPSKEMSNLSGNFTIEMNIVVTTMDDEIYSSKKIKYYSNEFVTKLITQSNLHWWISKDEKIH